MNWPTAFCIVGSAWAATFMLGYYTQFKRYRMNEVVASILQLEADVKKLKETK
jgi:hypothetical protein